MEALPLWPLGAGGRGRGGGAGAGGKRASWGVPYGVRQPEAPRGGSCREVGSNRAAFPASLVWCVVWPDLGPTDVPRRAWRETGMRPPRQGCLCVCVCSVFNLLSMACRCESKGPKI